MKKQDKLIFIGILLIIIIPITINYYFLRKKLSLIEDVEDIVSIIEELELPESTYEIVIDNGYTLNNKKYKVKGHGQIFLDKDYSIFLSRDGMCALKLAYDKKVMFQNDECPNYKLVDGVLKKIDK